MGKILTITIFWVCVNIMLMLTGFDITADQGNLVTGFLGDDITGVNNTAIANALPTQLEVAQSDSSSALFVDNTKTTFTFWSLIANTLGGSFIAVLSTLGLGSPIQLLIGVPLTIIAFIGLIAFVRGYDL